MAAAEWFDDSDVSASDDDHDEARAARIASGRSAGSRSSSIDATSESAVLQLQVWC